jgi:hypothetical protein
MDEELRQALTALRDAAVRLVELDWGEVPYQIGKAIEEVETAVRHADELYAQERDRMYDRAMGREPEGDV